MTMTMTAEKQDHQASAYCYSNGCRRPECRAAATTYQNARRAFIRTHGHLTAGWRQLMTTTSGTQ